MEARALATAKRACTVAPYFIKGLFVLVRSWKNVTERASFAVASALASIGFEQTPLLTQLKVENGVNLSKKHGISNANADFLMPIFFKN